MAWLAYARRHNVGQCNACVGGSSAPSCILIESVQFVLVGTSKREQEERRENLPANAVNCGYCSFTAALWQMRNDMSSSRARQLVTGFIVCGAWILPGCIYKDASDDKCAGMPPLNMDKQGVCYKDEGFFLFVLNTGHPQNHCNARYGQLKRASHPSFLWRTLRSAVKTG